MMDAPDISGLQRVAIAPSQQRGNQLCLNDAQTHYLGRVLRLQAGDRFIAMDGQGTWWLAIWQGTAIAQIAHEILVTTELPIPLALMVAMPKGNGMDEIIRQTTELGVSEIWPIMSDRTLLQPSPNKLSRWQRIATEAAEQSERQLIPKIHPPQPWHAALETLQAATHDPSDHASENHASESQERAIAAFLCTARQGLLLRDSLSQVLRQTVSPTQVVVATGPEGGWTDAEIKQAIAHSFIPVSLGGRILRAITAPIAATALVAHYLESKPVSHDA
ncbi:MAG: 16S rRNA (uracil(1498)-N(3))-methyltransferase [Cyanobacteria bacterium J06638_22]